MIKKFYLIKFCFFSGIIVLGGYSMFAKTLLRIEEFYYPVFQTSFFFLGELLCFFIMVCKGKVLKIKEKEYRYSDLSELHQNWLTKLGTYSYVLTGFISFLSLLFESIAYNYISLFDMASLKCLNTLFVIYYRAFHVNRTVFRHQKLGLGIYLAGMLIIILEIILVKSSNSFDLINFICVMIVIVAEVLNATNLVMVEYVINKLNTPSEKVNAVQGLTGFLVCLALYVPVGFILKIFFPQFEFLDPIKTLQNNHIFIIVLVSIVFVSFLLTFIIVKTLTFAESLTICTVESGKIFIIWLLNFFIENKVNFIEISGGVLIILGSLIFNEIIVIPMFGFKKSAKLSIEQNRLYLRQRSQINNLNKDLFMDPVRIH